MLPQLYTLFYGGAAGARLQVAERLFRLHGVEMAEDKVIAAGMADLDGCRRALRRQMLAMEMDRTCTRCAQGSGGGCCSDVFAAETDVAQLLMNMLAGVVVDARQGSGAECCFLGAKGCIFLFKPMFCLNYNCNIITCGGRPAALRELEKRTGMMLRAQQVMEGKLIDFSKERIFVPDPGGPGGSSAGVAPGGRSC